MSLELTSVLNQLLSLLLRITTMLRFIQPLIIALVLGGQSSAQGLFEEPRCYLTINELASTAISPRKVTSRELELNWENFNFPSYEGHRIGLFKGNPTQMSLSPLETHKVKASNGSIKTKTQIQPLNLTSVKDDETCLGDFYVAYYRPGDTLPFKANCIKLYPKWMNNMRGIIGDKKLRQVMTPGAHDAGSWWVYDGTVYSDSLLARFTYTHEEDIYNQLVSGIRYLDIRITYYPSELNEVFWINHGPVRIRELSTVLRDVKKFVSEFNEIVYLDFHGLSGFVSDSIHEKLYKYVLEFLEPNLAPNSFTTNVTFNELWAANKTVLLSYANAFYKTKTLLWPSVTHAFGDKDTVPDLRQYLTTAITEFGCTDRFWSQMAQLTANALAIIVEPFRAIRERALEANKQINTKFYKKPEVYSKSHIVSLDFYMGTDLVQTCITVNRNGGVKC